MATVSDNKGIFGGALNPKNPPPDRNTLHQNVLEGLDFLTEIPMAPVREVAGYVTSALSPLSETRPESFESEPTSIKPISPEQFDQLVLGAAEPQANTAAGILDLIQTQSGDPTISRTVVPTVGPAGPPPEAPLPDRTEMDQINALNDAISQMDLPGFTQSDRSEIFINNMLGGLAAGLLDATTNSSDIGEALARTAVGALGGFAGAGREIRKERKAAELSAREKLIEDIQRSQDNLARAMEFKQRYQDIRFKNRLALYNYEQQTIDWSRPDVKFFSNGTVAVTRNTTDENGKPVVETEVLSPAAVNSAKLLERIKIQIALDGQLRKEQAAAIRSDPAYKKLVMFAEAGTLPLTMTGLIPGDRAEEIESQLLSMTAQLPAERAEEVRSAERARILNDYYHGLRDAGDVEGGRMFGMRLQSYVARRQLERTLKELED